jgi:hypothetical protein
MYSSCYVYVLLLLCLCILIVMYVPFWVFSFIVLFYVFFVYKCVPGVNPIAVNKYIMSYDSVGGIPRVGVSSSLRFITHSVYSCCSEETLEFCTHKTVIPEYLRSFCQRTQQFLGSKHKPSLLPVTQQ